MHIPNVPPEVVEKIRTAMKRPEGTTMFRYTFDKLFDPTLGYSILLEIVTGAILFRLERDSELNLHFIHSSPGTGTREAIVDLNPLKGSMPIEIALAWSPHEIHLHAWDACNPERSVVAEGMSSQRNFRIGNDGAVYQIGNNVKGISIFTDGKPTLEATSIESWNDTVEAIKILVAETLPAGAGCVITNLIIVMLVTGFESYCKRRFLEIEDEGIYPNFDALVNGFLSVKEREYGEHLAIMEDAVDGNITHTRKLVEQKRIDFQNYDRCKTAFNKGYGLKFGEDISIPNTHLEEIQRVIRYRHRIVHVSPLIFVLNQERILEEESVEATKEYARKVLKVFNDFIQGLHVATLRLRPKV